MADVNPNSEIRAVTISVDRTNLNDRQYIQATVFQKNQLGDRDQVASIEVDDTVVMHINGNQHIAITVALDERDRPTLTAKQNAKKK